MGEAAPRALVILPAERGAETTGDRVVLRRLSAFLDARFDCRFLPLGRLGGVRKSLNVLLHRLPLELAPYWRAQHRAAVRSALDEYAPNAVFILHEGLFYLADEIDVTRAPTTLFAHNMLSRFILDSRVQPVLAALSRRYERRWYGKRGVRLVLISKGDRDEAAARGIASADAPVAPPGSPPATPLAAGAVFVGEAVVTGTYDWWRKRRDLKSFGAVAAGLRLVAFDARVAEAAPGTQLKASADEVDWGAAIRVGVITDAFVGGFKLKALEYVARNCVVFSRASILAEFADLPHARRFVIDSLPVSRWPERIAALEAEPQAALHRDFLEFKAACLARFDWTTCLEPLAPGLTRT